jgi:hypothetical protein
MDTTKYQLHYASEKHGNFYAAIDPNNYHLSRYVAAGVQNIYSASGSTKDYLDAMTAQMLDIINTGATGRIISDMAVLVNNIRYRLNHPIDQDAAIRMGCIYLIHEDENPDEVNPVWVTRKLGMVKEDAGLYDCFFTVGVTHTPSWKEALSDLGEMQTYLNRRNEALASLSIQSP